MFWKFVLAAVAVATSVTPEVSAEAPGDCHPKNLTFIYLQGDATAAAIVDDIAADLALVGISAVPEPKATRDDLNADMQAGKFNIVFSETWGNPYDPHGYLASWKAPNEAHHKVLENLDGKLDASIYGNRVDAILSEPDESKRAQLYTSLLNDIHQAYIHIPLYGKRMPSVINKRLMGYTPGNQQFDYPVHKLRAVTGSNVITVSPGSSGGLFDSVGRLDPHSYRPNEFWANNWVYEGLVKFGVNGIEPALASSWSIGK